jgi:hypothetical protein
LRRGARYPKILEYNEGDVKVLPYLIDKLAGGSLRAPSQDLRFPNARQKTTFFGKESVVYDYSLFVCG